MRSYSRGSLIRGTERKGEGERTRERKIEGGRERGSKERRERKGRWRENEREDAARGGRRV